VATERWALRLPTIWARQSAGTRSAKSALKPMAGRVPEIDIRKMGINKARIWPACVRIQGRGMIMRKAARCQTEAREVARSSRLLSSHRPNGREKARFARPGPAATQASSNPEAPNRAANTDKKAIELPAGTPYHETSA